MMDHRDLNSSSSEGTPDRLGTNIPSGGLEHGGIRGHQNNYGATHSGGVNEKAPAQEGEGEEEEEEDIDALIAELESEDGAEDDDDEAGPGASAKPIPEELLQTDTRKGLTHQEVIDRRRKYGLNQMAEEKENLFKKFLMYFVGPIQFVMEVMAIFTIQSNRLLLGSSHSRGRSSRLGGLRCHLRTFASQRYRRFRPGIPGWFYCRRIEENPCPQSGGTSRRCSC